MSIIIISIIGLIYTGWILYLYNRKKSNTKWNRITALIGALLPFWGLVFAFYAIWEANKGIDKTLEKADKQFAQNSHQSDSLFKVQLKHTKDLNDSLVSSIKLLQQITKDQYLATKEQLKISRNYLDEQIYMGRPILNITSEDVVDTNVVIGNLWSPRVIIQIKNVGKRIAKKVLYQSFIITPDLLDKTYNCSDSLIFEPDMSQNRVVYAKIPVSYKNDFIFCYQITYYDEKLKKYSYTTQYRHYAIYQKIAKLYISSDIERIRIRSLLNDYLFKNKHPIFKE